MLYQEEFVAVGTIRKGHGFRGHARIEVDDQYEADFEKQKFLFLMIDGYPVPFRITESTQQRHHLIKLEHIDSPEELIKYHQASIYLLARDVSSVAQTTHAPALEGMTLIDSTSGLTGLITQVEEYPQQVMATIVINDSTHLVPIHEDLINDIDMDNMTISMALPEGLLDL